MARICPKCGNIVEDNARFCDECGEPINPINEDKSSQTNNMYEGEQNVSNAQPQINMYSSKYTQNIETNVPVRNGKKVLGIVSLICGIFSIVTIGCWLLPEIAAIVCGVLTKDETGKRTKLGNAGFICGIIGTALLVFLIVIVIALL